MLQTNPYAKEKRVVKKTILLYVEGLHEQTFLKYLVGEYNRGSGVRVSIKNGRGGSPDYLADQAIKIYSDYDSTIIVYDSVPPLSVEKYVEIQKYNIDVIKNERCLESMLLNIIRDKSFSHKSSMWCKKEFEGNYIHRRDRRDVVKYKKVFPRSLLEEMRQKIENLQQLISIIEDID